MGEALSWRLRTVVGEGLRNVLAGGARNAATIGLMALLLTGAALVEARTLVRVQADERALVAAGLSTVVVSRDPESPEATLDSMRCRSLNGRSGIRAAGPLWGPTSARALVPPRRLVTVVEGTGGSLAALTAQEPPPVWDAVIGRQLADELYLAPGAAMRIALQGQTRAVEVSAVEPLEAREASFGSAVILPSASTGSADACWIEFEPWVDPQQLAGTKAYFDGPSDWLRLRLVLPPSETLRDPAAVLEQRTSRHGWLLVGVVMSMILAISFVFRGTELALYRSFGMGRLEVTALVQTEVAALTGIASLVAVSVVGVVLSYLSIDLAVSVYAFNQITRAVALVMLFAVPAAMIGWARPVATQLKE